MVQQVELRIDDLSLNTATHQVTRYQKLIALTRKEFMLLEFLMRRPRKKTKYQVGRFDNHP